MLVVHYIHTSTDMEFGVLLSMYTAYLVAGTIYRAICFSCIFLVRLRPRLFLQKFAYMDIVSGCHVKLPAIQENLLKKKKGTLVYGFPTS